jgi:hypothetical protein
VQRGWRAIPPVDPQHAVAGGHPRSRCPADSSARCTAHLRHPHASTGRANRSGRGVAWSRRRLLHTPHVRSRPTRGARTRGAQLCSTCGQQRRLTNSHMRAVTRIDFL